MKKILIAFVLLATMGASAQTDWKKTERLMEDGSVEKVYSRAEAIFKKTTNSSDLLTAAWYMARAAAEYQEAGYDSAEARFRAILPRLEAPERAVCYVILGEPDSALVDEEVLKRTSSDRIRRFCEQTESKGINITPTVYDVVVRQLIYGPGSGSRSNDALALLQRLVDFHRDDAEELRLYLDIELLNVMANMRAERFNEHLLQSYINKYRGSKSLMLTDLYYAMALYLKREMRYVEAVTYCDSALALAPKSRGGANCANIKNELCAPSINIEGGQASSVVYPGRWSLNSLTYCNLNRIFFFVYPLENDKSIPFENLPQPVKQWQLDVEDDGSHKDRSIYFEVPPLEAGRYLLVASPSAKVKKEKYAYSEFFCTDMKVSRHYFMFQLVDFMSGKPIVGQRMDFCEDDNGDHIIDSAYSDADGRAEYTGAPPTFMLKIKRDGCLYKCNVWNYRSTSEEREMKTHVQFLNDRPIYHLGDTVHVALLCYESDGVDGRVVPNLQGQCTLKNPHSQAVDTFSFVSDEHGLVSLTFVIPADGMAGSWDLAGYYFSWNGDKKKIKINFWDDIRVEEYKPPKFMVSLDDLPAADFKAPVFGEPYTVRGIARAYSGASLAGAQVRYRIERYNYRALHKGMVASDTLEVATDGTFDITFTPLPDSNDDLSGKFGYDFYVKVEVTDLNGETHEARVHFQVGTQRYSLFLSGMETNVSRLSSVDYVLTDASYRPVKGTVTVSVQRLAAAPPLMRHPVSYYNKKEVRATFSREQFAEHYPGFAYPLDRYSYKDRAVEWSYEVRHEADGVSWNQTVALPEGLKSGFYRIVATVDDVSDTVYTTLTLPDERHVCSEHLVWFDLSDSVCEVGDRLVMRYGSAFDDVNIFYTLIGPDGVERDHRWLSAGTSIKQLSIPVDTELLGGFRVRLVAVKNGVNVEEGRDVKVPFTHKKLNVDIATFRDKLQPGQQEEWTIKVAELQSDRVTKSSNHSDTQLLSHPATLIMTMFDDALSSYGFLAGQWRIYPWRGYIDDYWSFSWMRPWYQDDSYNAFNRRELLEGKDPDLQKLTILRDFLLSMNRGRSQLYYSSNGGETTASSQGVLKGTVTDAKTRETLPFVNIVVKQDGKQVAGGVTDFDGVYCIKPLKEGTYDIEVSYVGYNRFVRSGVRVKPTGFTVLDIQLVPGATNLEEVVICEEAAPVIEIGNAESAVRANKAAIAEISDEKVVAVGGIGFDDGNTAPVQSRTNLSPSAFFVAGLETDSTGTATYRFRVPELLTRWRVYGLAYSDDLKIGNLDTSLVTQKSLMVQPNIPRFLRQGDSVVLMAKVVNLSDSARKVRVLFTLNNPNIPNTPNNLITKIYQVVNVPAQGSKQVTFPFNNLPRDLYVATYEITAQTCDEHGPQYSDGERGQIPVVSDRQAVTLSQPIYINGAGEKTFHFPLSTFHSPTATPHFLAAELVDNPVWLAVKSMPHLKETENPSNLYLANRLYVNTLAKEILDNLGNLDILDNLEKLENLADTTNTSLKINSDIRQTLLEATPWLRDAEGEVEQRQAIANYFDSTRISNELEKLNDQIASRQNSNGGWSWMPDGESSLWVTRQILQRLSILKQSDNQTIKQSLNYVDKEEQRHYEQYIKPYIKKDFKWAPDNIDYLYTRSFYGKGTTEAYKFYYKNALKNYRSYTGLYTQAQLALIFHRHGDKKAARDIVRRLKEKSLQSDEMGLYWRDNRGGWWWYERPVETQALLIQAFAEITPADTATIALMQQWLLKQKQANHWGNDRATVEAIRALMIQNNLKTQSTPNTLNNQIAMKACGAELTAPTEGLEGYRTQRWAGPALDSIIALNDSTITLRKETSGIAWGAVYFQYTDDMDKIPASESGITLKRSYLYMNNQEAPKVGDRVRVRIEITCDRTMEYLELIDSRPSCVEPVSTQSGWCWNQGLSYYVEVKNTATHCYINRLEKGSYVVEYDVFVTNPGTFLAGPVTMQCLYAPEFRATAPASRFATR